MSESELRASRARLAAHAAAERRRLERTLHDGVQQDLIAATVQMQLLRAALEDGSDTFELVDSLRCTLLDAGARARELARDLYPAVLETRGLGAALADAARAAGVRANVDASAGRRPAGLEAAVYFCWTAALASVAPGAEVTIVVRESADGLRVELGGAGLDAVTAGDLVEAAGGRVAIEEDGWLTATIPASA